MEGMIKFRNALMESADILDEFIGLKAKEDEGINIEKEYEAVLGRFMLKMMELQSLQENL